MVEKKKTTPKLLVVFDTSILFSQVAYDLVCNEVKTFISANSKHPDLCIQWYLPRTVIDERRYQMQNKAFELLPSITKLETLLGHNLNITEDILINQVDAAIEKQLKELQISTLYIDTAKVDWNSLINRAINRTPPFEPGDKEKGFRDSLIAETFLQLVQQSPATPSVCRLAIITNDNLLAKYITTNTKDANNVRVLSNIGELGSLINTLVSQVTEEFVAGIKEKVNNFFFEEKNNSSLLYKENIIDKIKESYGEQLKTVPKVGLLRENGTWRNSPPFFIRKVKQRIFWKTFIIIDAEAFKLEFSAGETLYTNPDFHNPMQPNLLSPLLPNLDVKQQYPPTILTGFPKTSTKVKIAKGQSSFEIYWSVNITQTKKLSRPQINEIKFVGTKWGEE